MSRDQIAEQYPVEAAERHAEARDDQRVAYRVPAIGKDHAIVRKCGRVVRAQRDDQRCVQQQRIEIGDNNGDRYHGGDQYYATAGRNAVERRLARPLAGDRHVKTAAHPIALQQEHDERGHEQGKRQRRAPT